MIYSLSSPPFESNFGQQKRPNESPHLVKIFHIIRLTNNVCYIIIYYRNESCRWCLQTPIRRFNSRDIDCFETTAIFGEMGGCFFFISKKNFYLSDLDKVIIPMITSKSVNTSMVDIGHHLPCGSKPPTVATLYRLKRQEDYTICRFFCQYFTAMKQPQL